jgi:hypothetical protein
MNTLVLFLVSAMCVSAGGGDVLAASPWMTMKMKTNHSSEISAIQPPSTHIFHTYKY